MKNCWWLFFTLVSVLCCVAYGQQNGALSGIEGIVREAGTKEPLVGINVVIVGSLLGASTDDDGRFVIEGVPPGAYSLRASAVGFRTQVRTDVVVNPSRRTQVTFELVQSNVELNEVNVATDYYVSSPDMPVSMRSQSYEEIRRLPGGFEDVVRAVSVLPGVAQAEPGRNDLIIRGGAPSENLFLIDNLEVPNINHFGTQGASGGPLSYINLDFVDGTTFSTGGFGVKYGDRLSSVLSIDLRNGRQDRFGGKATLAATQFGLNVEGPLGSNGSFLASARRSYLDFIFKASGFAFVPEYWDFTGKLHYRLSARDEVSVLGIGVLDDIKLFNRTREDIYDNSRILVSAQDQFVIGVSWRHLFSGGFTVVTAGQIYTEFDYRQFDTLLEPIFRSASRENEKSLRAEVTYRPAGFSEITLGGQIKDIRFASNISLSPFWTNYGQQLSVDARYDTLAYKAALYAKWTQSLGHLTVTGGVRWDYFNQISQRSEPAPRITASYKISDHTDFNVSAGRYYQAPALIWLVANPGNRNLRFLGVNQFIAGIHRLIRDDTKIILEAYRKEYFDYPASLRQPYLVMSNTGAGFGGSQEAFASFGVDPLVSAGSGVARGIELSIQKKLSEVRCYGIGSVSYNESYFTPLDGLRRPGSFDQRWILNLGGGYLFNDRWELSAKFRFATGRPYTPFNPDGTQSSSRYNSERLGTNHSLDIRVDRRWHFSAWSLLTYIDIQNIYNKKPHEIPYFDERTGRTKEDESIGILPSIGISAEF